ncbi:MAG: hypothetical protein SFX18_04130 [Pirellulales bacterium]|nr:hypothetical protein [Pirellulales bacterium]
MAAGVIVGDIFIFRKTPEPPPISIPPSKEDGPAARTGESTDPGKTIPLPQVEGPPLADWAVIPPPVVVSPEQGSAGETHFGPEPPIPPIFRNTLAQPRVVLAPGVRGQFAEEADEEDFPGQRAAVIPSSQEVYYQPTASDPESAEFGLLPPPEKTRAELQGEFERAEAMRNAAQKIFREKLADHQERTSWRLFSLKHGQISLYGYFALSLILVVSFVLARWLFDSTVAQGIYFFTFFVIALGLLATYEHRRR